MPDANEAYGTPHSTTTRKRPSSTSSTRSLLPDEPPLSTEHPDRYYGRREGTSDGDLYHRNDGDGECVGCETSEINRDNQRGTESIKTVRVRERPGTPINP